MVEQAYWPFKDIADPDDSEFAPRGVSCVKISDALGRVGENNAGLYAFWGSDGDLPALPGLVVRDAGVIPLPLAESFSKCLLDRCSRVKEGDDSRWELAADQLWMKNPEWNHKIGELGVTIGEKLGFQDVLLDVILSKLVVYAPGGHVKRQKDSDEQEDVVAKLVVQLPSLHEGGDLVVFDDEDTTKKYKFDFGKSTGTAAFNPSYAVYVAGAEYQVEEVKKGYRVVMVYSIRLPSDENMTGVNRSRRHVQNELKEAMQEFGGTNETFALLLANEYERFEIEGSQRRLTGEDRRRFQALQKANGVVPTEKKLKFYLAKVHHTAKVVKDIGDGGNDALYRSYPLIQTRNGGAQEPRWRIRETFYSVVWFSPSGQIVQNGEYANDTFNWTSKLNFLNPDRVSPRTTWSKHVSHDELVLEKTIEYKANAIIAWPVTHDLVNVTSFIGEDVALSLILADEPVSASKLRAFMNMATENEQNNDKQDDKNSSPYTNFCMRMCKAITAAGDAELVWLFFIRFFDSLKRKEQLTPSLVSLVQGFGWGAVHTPLINAVNRASSLDAMDLAVELAKACDGDRDVRAVLTMVAAEKAQLIPGNVLASSKHAKLLLGIHGGL